MRPRSLGRVRSRGVGGWCLPVCVWGVSVHSTGEGGEREREQEREQERTASPRSTTFPDTSEGNGPATWIAHLFTSVFRVACRPRAILLSVTTLIIKRIQKGMIRTSISARTCGSHSRKSGMRSAPGTSSVNGPSYGAPSSSALEWYRTKLRPCEVGYTVSCCQCAFSPSAPSLLRQRHTPESGHSQYPFLGTAKAQPQYLPS